MKNISLINGSNNFWGGLLLSSLTSCSKANINYDKLNNIPNLAPYSSNVVGYPNKNEIIKKIRKENNNFIDNAEKSANEECNLFYSIGWVAQLHKFGVLGHLIKVLELNPNKNIFLYVNTDVWQKNSFDFSVLEKYPNFHLRFVHNGKSQDIDASKMYLESIEDILEDIKNYNLINEDNRLFMDDWNIFQCIFRTKTTLTDKQIDNVINTILPLLNFNEINLIPDGTATTSFFSNYIYSLYKMDRNFEFDLNTNSFKKLQNYIIDLKKLNKSEIRSILKSEKSADKLIMSILSAGKTNYEYGPKVNFYLPSTNLLLDVNNETSSELNLNDQFNEFFDPFDSLDFSIIDLFLGMKTESKKMFEQVCKLSSVSKFEPDFKDNTNVIYGGGLMNGNEKSIKENAERIIQLFDKNKDKKNLKIWFKAHPRESDGYVQNLKNMIIKISKNKDIANCLYSLDKNIPLEYYIVSGLFINNETTKSLLYLGYTTFALCLRSSSLKDSLSQVIISNQDINDVNYRFGSLKESRCFNESFTVLENDF